MNAVYQPACKMKWFGVAVCLIFICHNAAVLTAQEVRVTAEAEPNPVGVDEQLTLMITVTGPGSATAPQIPKVDGLKLTGGPAVSNQYQWINGQSSSSQVLTYYFEPEREGSFKIPPISVKVGGKAYPTQELSIKVVKDSGGGQRSAARRRNPFSVFDDMLGDEDSPVRERALRRGEVLVVADVDKKNVSIGEQVTLSYKVLTQLPITQIELKENPAFNGFWVEDIPTPKNPEAQSRVINGKQYAEYVVKKQALFPTSAGNQQIPASTFGLVVRTSGGGLFSLGIQEAVVRKTDPIQLKVAPFPEKGKPSVFSGAVGNFKLESKVDKASADTGDAVNLKVTLTGVGNLKTITDFPMPDLPGFKIYSSKSNDSTSFKNDLMQGTKTWDYVIIPQAPGQEVIPELKFNYFSPESRQYQVSSSPALPIEVHKGKGTPGTESGPVSMIQQGIVKRGSDINYIKFHSGPLQDRSRHVYQSVWIYPIVFLPILFNGFLLFYINRQAQLQRDLIGFRRRKAGRIAERRLVEARRCLDKN
ncbi:MAG: BatD family protein, partial [Terriglobia bacterium]